MAMIIAVSFTNPTPARAQGAYPTVTCDACRNPRAHPRDVRNFAFNQLFAPDGWMTFEQGDFFQVTTRDGHSVFVDMNMNLAAFTINLGIPIPLPYPTAVQVQVIVIYEDGDQKKWMIDPRAHPNGLPVGGRSRGGPGGGSGGGNGGGNGSGGGSDGPPSSGGNSRGRCGITRVDNGPGRRTCI